MKNYFKFSAGFIGLYLFFILSSMPLSFVSQWFELPKNVFVGKVSGSIWQGEISSLVVDGITINKVESELSFFSLLLFSPEIKLSFGAPSLKGPEGSVTISGVFSDLTIDNMVLSTEANLMTNKLQLPIPIVAHDILI